jgi:UDP-glucuronate decarboxylase
LKNLFLSSDIDEVVERISNIAKDLSGKNVLLTGGRGFLGRYFVEIFDRLNKDVLDKPVTLIVLDNLITAGKEGAQIPKYNHIEFIKHNVIQPFAYEGALDYVIHAAGIASPYYYRAYPIETMEVAINGTRNMLELAKKSNARFSFFSSSEIYGDPDAKNVPMQESYRGNVSCQGPRACYDESKRAGETLCYIYHTQNGTATNTIRPFNIYGPGMQETDYRVLPNFASRIKSGSPLHIYGDGTQTRTFCYITDALVGFFKVFLKGVPGEAYNIGNPKPEVSMIDLAEALKTISSSKIKYDIIEYPDSYPADEPMRRSPDIRKARLQLGFEPIVGFKEGLSRFLLWTNEVYVGEQ